MSASKNLRNYILCYCIIREYTYSLIILLYKLDLVIERVNIEITRPNVAFSCLINHSRFRNSPVAPKRIFGLPRACLRRTLTKFRAFGTIWYQRQVLACSLRNACTRPMLAHTREQAETVNPETRRGRCVRLLSRGNELRSRTDTADVIYYSTGRTTRRNRSIEVRSIFFSSNKPGGRAFLSAVSLLESRS